jgi:hypothetical protein
MAGLEEYRDEGFSSYHGKKNPFIIAQVRNQSPAKWAFLPALFGGGGAAAAGGTAATTAAAGAAGAAGTAGIIGKVGGAIAKGASWLGKGIAKGVKAITKPIGKLFGKKAAIGNVSKTASKGVGEAVVKGAGTGPPSFSNLASPSATTSASTASTKSSVIGDFAKSKMKSFTDPKQLANKAFSSMNASNTEQREKAKQKMESSISAGISNMPQIGDTSSRVPEEDFESIIDSPSVYNKNLRNGPFKMKGWTPFKSKASDKLKASGGAVERALAKVGGGIKNVAASGDSFINKYK